MLKKKSDRLDLLVRYRSLREKQKALHHEFKDYLSKGAVVKSAKRLGIYYKNRSLMLGSSEEMSILMDYLHVVLPGRPRTPSRSA